MALTLACWDQVSSHAINGGLVTHPPLLETSVSGPPDPHTSLWRAQSQTSWVPGVAANWLGDLENVIALSWASASKLFNGESDQLGSI